MKVQNMTNGNGRSVPNQFIIFTPDATFFQSYQKIIVKTTFEDGERAVYLDKRYWDYSVTTGRWRNEFLGEKKRETERKIKEGVYKLADLNG